MSAPVSVTPAAFVFDSRGDVAAHLGGRLRKHAGMGRPLSVGMTGLRDMTLGKHCRSRSSSEQLNPRRLGAPFVEQQQLVLCLKPRHWQFVEFLRADLPVAPGILAV